MPSVYVARRKLRRKPLLPFKHKSKSWFAGERKRSNFRELDPWMNVPPPERERKSKMVNNRLFHWCQFHMQCRGHKSADCRLGKQKVPTNKEASLKKQEKKKQSKLVTALEAIDDELLEDKEEQ